jgi:hypothetical protein
MAYMNQEKKAVIKAAMDKVLKARGFKYSLRVSHHSSIACTIQSGPMDFGTDYEQVNLYWIDDHYSGEALQILQECREALQAAGYYDRSNAQIDYFDTAYYMHLNIGAWDKPYKLTAPTIRQAAALMTEEAIKARIQAQGCSADFVNNQFIVKVIA